MSIRVAQYLMKYLPEDYQKSAEVIEIQEGIGGVWLQIQSDIEDLKAQMDLETATWGLVFWEMDYSIETDLTKTFDMRRSVIKARRRGAGTTTVEMIKNMSESFVNGEVEIEEQNSQYSFNVVMVSTIGIPPNINDLKKAIEEVKPAHLDYTIVYRYNTHAMLGAFTYGQLKEMRYTYQELRIKALPDTNVSE